MMLKIFVYILFTTCALGEDLPPIQNNAGNMPFPPQRNEQPNNQQDLNELKSLIANLKFELSAQMDDGFGALQRLMYNNQNQLMAAIDALSASNSNSNFVNQPRVTLVDVEMFPGSNEDYLLLVPLLSKTSKCNNCSTCRKNEICVFKTYETLKSIISNYPNWNPPVNVPARPSVNQLLKNVLLNISANVDNSDLVYLFWGTDQKLKHLINPLFLASLKLPAKNQKVSFNPALFIALSQGNIDPATMMALMGEEVNPMYLAMNGNVDPMTLALMGNKNVNPLLLSFMKNKGNQQQQQQQTGGCGNARNNTGECNKVQQRNKRVGNNTNNQFDPNLLLLLSQNGDNNGDLPMALMLMNMMNGNNSNNGNNGNNGNNANRNFMNVAKANPQTTSGYGRVEEVANVEEAPGLNTYGKSYGR